MNYDLMKDEVIKKIFTSKIVGKKLSAAIIANTLNIDEQLILDNLEFVHPNISHNVNTINSVADIVLESFIISIFHILEKMDMIKIIGCKRYFISLFVKIKMS